MLCLCRCGMLIIGIVSVIMIQYNVVQGILFSPLYRQSLAFQFSYPESSAKCRHGMSTVQWPNRTVCRPPSLLGQQSSQTCLFGNHGRATMLPRKLGRNKKPRKRLLRHLTQAVLRHGYMTVTTAKAKEIRYYVNRIITLAKRNTSTAYNEALRWMYDRELTQAIFREVPYRYSERSGSFVRIQHVPKARRGDGSSMSTIELV
eukprot:GHVQ01025867.1.p1 GENE.GHVQ01025867.1~~GHVQ01025867.1.p1  ORF type:complete len:203 (+),score=5.57 GHVQ01025867.1:675-1283(+)